MKYLIEKEISRGGFATVYRGLDVAQRPAAIKTYHVDRDVRQVLTNSVRTHKLLNQDSPRFPKLYCHDERSLVMEFIDGVNLSSLGHHQAEDVVLVIAYQLAVCLYEFHGSRLENSPIHRDVKPGNIIVRRDGILVLCDFDLSMIDEFSIDGSERMIGTPQFYSPEQIKGTQVLPISDLFSVGSTLYKILTGECLFRSSVDPYVDIEDLVNSALKLLSGYMGEVIGSCWRRERSYKNAEHMVAELAERLKKVDIDPEKSHEVLAGLVNR